MGPPDIRQTNDQLSRSYDAAAVAAGQALAGQLQKEGLQDVAQANSGIAEAGFRQASAQLETARAIAEDARARREAALLQVEADKNKTFAKKFALAKQKQAQFSKHLDPRNESVARQLKYIANELDLTPEVAGHPKKEHRERFFGEGCCQPDTECTENLREIRKIPAKHWAFSESLAESCYEYSNASQKQPCYIPFKGMAFRYECLKVYLALYKDLESRVWPTMAIDTYYGAFTPHPHVWQAHWEIEDFL